MSDESIRKIAELLEQTPEFQARADALENEAMLRQEKEEHGVDPSLVHIPFSEIKTEPVHWLWYPYLPQGKLCLLGGDPGQGKTYVACAFMAALSRGSWPFTIPGGTNYGTAAHSIYCFMEDGAGDTIRPRLEEMEADLSRVIHFKGKRDRKGMVQRVLMNQVAEIIELATYYQAKLIIFDPMQRFLPATTKMNDMESVAVACSCLMQIAEQTGATVLLLGHLNKGKQETLGYKFMGSVDWLAAARSALMVMKDPNDKERRYLYQVKNSLAPQADGVKFHIYEHQRPRFMWGEQTTISAEEMFASSNGKASKADVAMEWMREILAKGEQESEALKKLAKEAGISHRAFWNAKERLEIKPQKGRGIFSSKWYWSLPSVPDENGTDR